jgi:hypothetical protein
MDRNSRNYFLIAGELGIYYYASFNGTGHTISLVIFCSRIYHMKRSSIYSLITEFHSGFPCTIVHYSCFPNEISQMMKGKIMYGNIIIDEFLKIIIFSSTVRLK